MSKLTLSLRAEGDWWSCQQQWAEEEEWQVQIKELPVIFLALGDKESS